MVALPLPKLPDAIAILQTLALDLRWTWSHEGDALWSYMDENLWRQTQNPWSILQSASAARLQALADDAVFRDMVSKIAGTRRRYLERSGWFESTHGASGLGGVAYFSMEFGLGTALPLYAGGLGVLAGDFLKTASDLGVPAIGIGLLYQEGYFRQTIDFNGAQQELYPYNEPATMPIEPVILADGSWMRIALEVPGRTLQIRIWRANVGRVPLYLLDSNDALNSPADRGITAKLYGSGSETRLMQEIVLGVAGWRIVEQLHPKIEICHMNEGHAGFAAIERARHLAVARNLGFWEAWWAVRAGNVFTTHTPVAAAFDTFPAVLLRKYLPYVEGELAERGVSLEDILRLGRGNPANADEAFNMAFLAERGSALTLAVSQLHGEVSRRIFQPLFPRWPSCEVPIDYVTNGVHVPTWDSTEADSLWTATCGKERWRSTATELHGRISEASDSDVWAMRGKGRQRLVATVRSRLGMQLRERGAPRQEIQQAETVFDPNVLTIGFARRFTEYKRPTLLLHDQARLEALLQNDQRPIQIVVAGKAHPADVQGKAMIGDWIRFARKPQNRRHVVYLEDYDIALAQEMVQGVDVWINTPRRPWEACGTSGMKVLVNGGLNCSIRDGWWDEAYEEGLGWAIDDGSGGEAAEVDPRDAAQLYDLLETQIIPEFYDRDAAGLPRSWLARIGRSMAALTSRFSSARMVREYVEKAYLPLSRSVASRLADQCRLAMALRDWSSGLERHWHSLHIGVPTFSASGDIRRISVPVFFGDLAPDAVAIELFADGRNGEPAEVIALHREQAVTGAQNGYVYAGDISVSRDPEAYTVRAVPSHPDVRVPAETQLIAWQR